MPFSSFLKSGSRDAGTVVLRAETGEFNAKVEQAERQWRESVGSMSREAIKLDLAQDRLRRSLAQYGAESAQAKRATIGLKDAQDQAARAARGLDRANDGARRSFGGLKAAAVGAIASVGVYGLGAAIRSTVDAAKESELVLGQTKLAVEAAGQSWEQYEKQIEQVIAAQAKLGFDDETLLKTFSSFVTRTKDVGEALRLNALAADVARGRYIDLEQAAQIVLKASLGQLGAVRRMGIDVEKNATAMQLLTKLTEAYGGRAQGALGTATAATERMNVSIGNAKELIGSGLTPIVADLANQVSDYLEDAGRQEEIQKRVNEIVKDGAAVVRGFAGAMRSVRAVIRPVIDGLGGMENAARLLFTMFAVSKLVAIAGAIRGVGIAARFARTQVGLLATTPVGPTVGRGVAIPAVGGAGPAGAALAVGTLLLSGQIGLPGGLESGNAREKILKAQELYRVDKQAGIRYAQRNGVPLGLLDPAFAAAEGVVAPGEGRPNLTGSPRTTPRSTPTPASGRGNGLSRIQMLELAAQKAQLTAYLSDDLKAAQAIEAYYAKIASNEKLKGDKLFAARQNLLSAQQRTQAIEDQIAADQAAADQKAADRRRERAAKLAAQRERQAQREREEREERERQAEIAGRWLGTGPYATTSSGFNKAGIDPFRLGEGSSAKSKVEVVTPADLDRVARDLIMGFAEIQKKYAPNFQLGNHVLVEATREQTGVLRDIAMPRRFRDSAGLEQQAEVVMS